LSPQRLKIVLARLRESKGLTKRELARRAKVTEAYVSQLESGARRNPSLPVLKRLAKALGVPVTELLS
jgi:transcriptional regulator with XRE-family HTH domain